jgi:hypothetical protein
MAYVVSTTRLFGGAAVTNLAITLPAHVAGDYFVIFSGMDTGTTTAGGTMTWAAVTGVTQNVTGTGITSTLIYAKTAGAAETLTITTADAYAIQLIQIRGADQTTPFDGTGTHATNGATLSNVLTSGTFATSLSNSLVLYFVASEGTATQTHSDPGVMSLASHDSTGTTATTSAASSAAWYIQAAAGTVPAATWSSSLSTTFTRATIAFRNAAGGIVPAYVMNSPAPATRITSAFHIGTVDPTFTFPAALTNIGNVAGKTRTFSAAVLGADFGVNPYASGISKTSATVAATSLAGYEINFATARNMTGQLLVGSLIANSPKTGTFSLGSIAQGGSVLAVGTSTTAWNAYQIAASDSKPTTEQRYVFAIQPGFSGTAYATGTASATVTSIDFFQFIENYPNGTAGVTYLSEFHQANEHIVAGGTSTNPVDNDGLVGVGKSFLLPLIQKTGPTSLVSYIPIRIGGGSPINFMIDFGTLQFPRRANTTLREISFHANNNVVGIEYHGKAGDSIKHTNSVITSPNKYYWRFNAATGNTGVVTYDFSGLSVIGAGQVGLSSVVPLSEVSFVQCDEIDISSANTLTSCVFAQSTASATTGGVIKITSSTEAGLQSIVNKLVNCQFEDNLSNAAIDIIYTGTAGPITLSMTSGTFSGNSKDIRWDAPASSNLTINLSGTADPITSFATNGNIVTLVNTKTFTVTNVTANTELRLYKQSDMSLLAGVEDIGNTTPGAVNFSIANDTENTGKYTATYSYSYTGDIPVYVVAHSLSFQWLRSSATLKSTNSELKISQIPDRQYQNP